MTEQAIGDVHMDAGAGDQTDEVGADPVRHPDDRGASQRRGRAQFAGEPSDPVLVVTDDQGRRCSTIRITNMITDRPGA